MRKWLGSVLDVIMALSVVVVLAWAASSTWEVVRVAGQSMAPALNLGDLVVVRKGHHPREGDIVLVRGAGHGSVLHRVVAITGDGSVTTKGDANSVEDRDRAGIEQISGVVVRVVPIGAVLRGWRRATDVEYHDGSTEQHEATTETTSDDVQSEQGWVQR